MRQLSLFTAATFLVGIAGASPAIAATSTTTNTIGADCKVLGTTQMSDDKTGIIGCFLVTGTTGTAPSCTDSSGNANGKCQWKSTSGGGIGECYPVVASCSATGWVSPPLCKLTGVFNDSTSPSTVATARGYVNTSGFSSGLANAILSFGYVKASTYYKADSGYTMSSHIAYGLFCNEGYVRVSCSGASSSSGSSCNGDNCEWGVSVGAFASKNGCFTQGIEYGTTNSATMSAICCKGT